MQTDVVREFTETKISVKKRNQSEIPTHVTILNQLLDLLKIMLKSTIKCLNEIRQDTLLRLCQPTRRAHQPIPAFVSSTKRAHSRFLPLLNRKSHFLYALRSKRKSKISSISYILKKRSLNQIIDQIWADNYYKLNLWSHAHIWGLTSLKL
jgi:hypothetical protein